MQMGHRFLFLAVLALNSVGVIAQHVDIPLTTASCLNSVGTPAQSQVSCHWSNGDATVTHNSSWTTNLPNECYPFSTPPTDRCTRAFVRTVDDPNTACAQRTGPQDVACQLSRWIRACSRIR